MLLVLQRWFLLMGRLFSVKQKQNGTNWAQKEIFGQKEYRATPWTRDITPHFNLIPFGGTARQGRPSKQQQQQLWIRVLHFKLHYSQPDTRAAAGWLAEDTAQQEQGRRDKTKSNFWCCRSAGWRRPVHWHCRGKYKQLRIWSSGSNSNNRTDNMW